MTPCSLVNSNKVSVEHNVTFFRIGAVRSPKCLQWRTRQHDVVSKHMHCVRLHSVHDDCTVPKKNRIKMLMFWWPLKLHFAPTYSTVKTIITECAHQNYSYILKFLWQRVSLRCHKQVLEYRSEFSQLSAKNELDFSLVFLLTSISNYRYLERNIDKILVSWRTDMETAERFSNQ